MPANPFHLEAHVRWAIASWVHGQAVWLSAAPRSESVFLPGCHRPAEPSRSLHLGWRLSFSEGHSIATNNPGNCDKWTLFKWNLGFFTETGEYLFLKSITSIPNASKHRPQLCPSLVCAKTTQKQRNKAGIWLLCPPFHRFSSSAHCCPGSGRCSCSREALSFPSHLCHPVPPGDGPEMPEQL